MQVGETIGGVNASDVLQQAELPIVDHNTCRDKMKDLLKVYKSSTLCAVRSRQRRMSCKKKLNHTTTQTDRLVWSFVRLSARGLQRSAESCISFRPSEFVFSFRGIIEDHLFVKKMASGFREVQ